MAQDLLSLHQVNCTVSQQSQSLLLSSISGDLEPNMLDKIESELS